MSNLSHIHSVLFCCSLNSLRSPMAEGILKHFGKNRFFCDSCGINTNPVDPFMISITKEVGIPMHLHNPKTFENLDDFSFDLIIALSQNSHIKALEFTQDIACEVECWDTPDPSLIEGDRITILNAYKDLRNYLTSQIIQRFDLKSPS